MKWLAPWAAVVWLLAATVALAGEPGVHYTKKDVPACDKMERLQQMVEAMRRGQREEVTELLQEGCHQVKEDLAVIMEEDGLIVIKVRPRGFDYSLYMLREDLK